MERQNSMEISEKKANLESQENETALPSIETAAKLHPQEEKSIYFQSRETQETFLIITLKANICRNKYYLTNGAGIRLSNSGENSNILSFQCDVDIIISIVISQSLLLPLSEIIFLWWWLGDKEHLTTEHFIKKAR